MPHVTWQHKSGVLIGTLRVVSIPDDKIACQVIDELKEGVAAQLLEGRAAAEARDTRVLIDFAAVHIASTHLVSRVLVLVNTWLDLNVDLKLCRVSADILVGFESTSAGDAINIYASTSEALAAFDGKQVPTVTLASAAAEVKKEKRKRIVIKMSRSVDPRYLQVGGIILVLAVSLWVITFILGIGSNITPVGTITVNNELCPPGWVVMFDPVAPGVRAGIGITDSRGGFAINTSRTIEGIAAGEYIIRIRPDSETGSAYDVPAKYHEESDEVVNVTRGNPSFRFNLECAKIE